jgi:putative FmdB family regulatory protein
MLHSHGASASGGPADTPEHEHEVEAAMPTYAYSCTKCGEQIEVYQTFSEEPLKRHDGCGGKLQKVFSPVGIVLKGSGFYKTDSRAASRAKSKASSSSESKSESGSDSKSDSKADSGSDSKPEKKSESTKADSSSKGDTSSKQAPSKPAKKSA